MSGGPTTAPAGARVAIGAPRVAHGLVSAGGREACWPRLLAHLADATLDVALERSDRSLGHRRTIVLRAPDALAATLKAWLAVTGESPADGVLVIDRPLAQGRFAPRLDGRGASVEAVRIQLGLRALRVIDERTALSFAVRAPAARDVRWVLAPQGAPACAALTTVVCRLGSDVDLALLAPLGRGGLALPTNLLGHPFAPVGDDELTVVAAMRARGLAPVFGNLLCTAGIARSFEALSGIDYDNACPLPAEAVVSLAVRDERARRACAVVCAAIAQLCALLSFDGARCLLLAGRTAMLLAPQLAEYPLAERLRAVRAEAAELPVQVAVGVLGAPVRLLEGARETLNEALRVMQADASQTVWIASQSTVPS